MAGVNILKTSVLKDLYQIIEQLMESNILHQESQT